MVLVCKQNCFDLECPHTFYEMADRLCNEGLLIQIPPHFDVDYISRTRLTHQLDVFIPSKKRDPILVRNIVHFKGEIMIWTNTTLPANQENNQ